MSDTYHFIRLNYVGGESHQDFIFADREVAVRRFTGYIEAAKGEEQKYGADATVTITDRSVSVTVILLRYGHLPVQKVEWSASIYFDNAFER